MVHPRIAGKPPWIEKELRDRRGDVEAKPPCRPKALLGRLEAVRFCGTVVFLLFRPRGPMEADGVQKTLLKPVPQRVTAPATRRSACRGPPRRRRAATRRWCPRRQQRGAPSLTPLGGCVISGKPPSQCCGLWGSFGGLSGVFWGSPCSTTHPSVLKCVCLLWLHEKSVRMTRLGKWTRISF